MPNRIDELRKKADLTVQELASAAGMARGYLHELMSDRKRLNVDVMNALAKVLGCRPQDLLASDSQTGIDVVQIPVVAIVPGGTWAEASDNILGTVLFVREKPGNYKG